MSASEMLQSAPFVPHSHLGHWNMPQDASQTRILNQFAPNFSLSSTTFTPTSDCSLPTNKINESTAPSPAVLLSCNNEICQDQLAEKKKKKTRRGKGGGEAAAEKALAALREKQALAKMSSQAETQTQKERRKAQKGKTPNQIISECGMDYTKYKTEMCKNWIESGTCRYGTKCQFAHGNHELASSHQQPIAAIGSGGTNKYKSKVCQSFHEQNYCAYGQRCLFKHEDRTMKEVHERTYSIRLCQIIDVPEEHTGVVEHTRLSCFSKIELEETEVDLKVQNTSFDGVFESTQDTSSTEDSVDEDNAQLSQNLMCANSLNYKLKEDSPVQQCLWLLSDELDLEESAATLMW